MSRENLLSIESTVASQRGGGIVSGRRRWRIEWFLTGAPFRNTVGGEGDRDPLPWVLILFVKSSVGGRLRRGTVDGYLICMAGVQARVLTPSERRRMETLVSPRAILIVRPFNRFDSACCAVKR